MCASKKMNTQIVYVAIAYSNTVWQIYSLILLDVHVRIYSNFSILH